jgi:hypothetical protein
MLNAFQSSSWNFATMNTKKLFNGENGVLVVPIESNIFQKELILGKTSLIPSTFYNGKAIMEVWCLTYDTSLANTCSIW